MNNLVSHYKAVHINNNPNYTMSDLAILKFKKNSKNHFKFKSDLSPYCSTLVKFVL